MKKRPAYKFFQVYDAGELRAELDVACKELDLNRSQLIRHAVRRYLKQKQAEDRNVA